MTDTKADALARAEKALKFALGDFFTGTVARGELLPDFGEDFDLAAVAGADYTGRALDQSRQIRIDRLKPGCRTSTCRSIWL